jgi:putative PIN family toxin of toxin-antitoxin system
MKYFKIVIDNNVFISALRSRDGASYKLLMLTLNETFEIYISSTLIFEYESVAKREEQNLKISIEEINDILDYICSIGKKQIIYFKIRPFLQDSQDDFVLELAVAGKVNYIVTYNTKNFKGAELFDIKIIKPKEFLKLIGEQL